jgi:SAM-dependent methyltransferase
MVERSRERAKAEGVQDRVRFTVANARGLPFEDGRFDAVIMESVNIFFDDKQEAMREYLRVTRPGGYVGMTEMTWLKPPSPELEGYFKRAVYAEALEADGWTGLLEEASLKEIVGSAHQIDIPLESKGRFDRYGRWEMVKVMLRVLVMSAQDRTYRSYIKDARSVLSRDLLKVMGYGVYAGRKG